ncbi:CHAT domain-containing protein [Pseudozobellia thermophila]|nr:CHAT domain-containing tetratricopeptide repeat protein [Pseudozobellia thermophila]
MKKLKNIALGFLFVQTGFFYAQDIGSSFEKAMDYHYSNKDSAYFYYEKTIALARERNDIESELLAFSYLLNANSNFYDLSNYGRNISRADSLVKRTPRIDTLYMGQYFKDNLLFEKGSYYYKLKDYGSAQNYFFEHYKKLSAIPETDLTSAEIDMMSAIFSFLGLTYRHTGKYEQAEFYFKKDIDWVNNYRDSIVDWQSVVYNTKKLLSQVYEAQDKPERANQLLEEALEFYRLRITNPRQKNNFLSTYILLAKNRVQQGRFDEALDILVKNKSFVTGSNPFLKEVNIIFGDAYLGKKQYKKALSFYNMALGEYMEYRQHRPHQDVADVYGKIAELYLKQGDYTQGLEALSKAFNNAGSDIDIKGYDTNPSPERVFSKTQLLGLLDIKLRFFNETYERDHDGSSLDMALQTSRDILNTFDLLKTEFDSKLDKQFLAEKAYPIFERILQISHLAYEKEGSRTILELALNISERSKDFILLEALRSVQATKYGDVPDKVLEREARLRAEITQLEKQMFDATENEDVFSDNLFKAKQDYYNFLDSVGHAYPRYYNLKYKNEALSLTDIRRTLCEENTALISYTVATDGLYAIILGDKGENFIKMPFSESDKNEIREFYRLISKPSLQVSNDKLHLLGERLYDKVLKMPLEGITAENLIVVRDGELHYLPFDLLRHNEKYLLEDRSISYGNSFASLMELHAVKRKNVNKIIAFAPGFGDDKEANGSRQFGKLLYNDDEVRGIASFFDVELLFDGSATLRNFRSRASQFGIVHLATHASANDAFPDYSYLAFSQEKDSAQGNVLYIKDLYNTSLTANMVTLSACQTGIGKLQKGQGMLSLSKGFYYAGAKSLVNTLWKINDKSSVKLMRYFYEGLSEGKSKSAALRQAKLKYLETTDDRLMRHPYYWAAFAVSGDVSPVTTTVNWWRIGALLLLIVGFFTYFKGSRSNRP